MGPENFAPVHPMSQKLRHFFEGTHGRTHGHGHMDTRTHGRTHKKNHLSTTKFFLYVTGQEGNSTNPTKFLPLHFVKDNCY